MVANLELLKSTETICAPSSGRVKAGISVFRVSGPNALERTAEFFCFPKDIEPRKMYFGLLQDAESVIDEVLVCFFKGPNSFTGEDVVEIYCHGNPVIVDKIESLFVSRGTRKALPGEFTQRALVNEKISLDQAESLDWILNARSIDGVQLALRAKLGAIGIKIQEVRAEILDLTTEVEAQLDFDEIEVGEYQPELIEKSLAELVQKLEAWIASYESSRRFVDQPQVVIIGPPNSGKSSLFNSLIQRDQSIVFDQPGTTRDLIQASFVMDDAEFSFIDTAGLRKTFDRVEELGIRRSQEAVQRADLVIWLSESIEEFEGAASEFDFIRQIPEDRLLKVLSKSDLHNQSSESWLRTSAVSGQGISSVAKEVSSKLFGASDHSEAILTSSRQRELVAQAVEILRTARHKLSEGLSLDLVAESLKKAVETIEKILGKVETEEVLKSIFSRFCIGK